MYYEPRSQSPVPLQFGVLPPGYQSGRNTPLSAGHMQPMSDIGLLPQPGLSRPPTTYLDMPIPLTQEMDLTSGTPNDADLKRTVQDILWMADLNTVTEREICHQLKEHLSMDLTARKAMINAAIDHTLLADRDMRALSFFWTMMDETLWMYIGLWTKLLMLCTHARERNFH
ncbi:hypothetical protein SCLCIDRAFT_1217586 [Scleroderma citrinum Foug A]|uniref:DEK-C domain-containing protein n=1 Tax=Scleroderma citrinum Foug A TaxID=1036808 RepID=A0A0C3A4L4_9AGAM|nr:hypothetical protein SCLCIDRAFT_1217586 [Scleroderma citrinum Foug A]